MHHFENLTRYSPFEIGSCDVLCFSLSLLRRTTSSYIYFDSSYLSKEKIITNDPFLRSLQMAYCSRFWPIFFHFSLWDHGIEKNDQSQNDKQLSISTTFPQSYYDNSYNTVHHKLGSHNTFLPSSDEQHRGNIGCSPRHKLWYHNILATSCQLTATWIVQYRHSTIYLMDRK